MRAPIYDTNPAYTAIFALDERLTRRGVEHTMERIFDGWKIRVYHNGIELDDCIQHEYSHGAGLDLLEPYRLGECSGYMTSEEVMVGWTKMFSQTF